ncbi:MAG: hypothetical protein JNM93_14190 [Bacteriovoracaceae bacterium]|nr:hypothetical protein [Bacteriovoracaceae bacterium]
MKIIILLISLLSYTTHAQDLTPKENWYTLWGAGMTGTLYDDENVNDAIDELQDIDDVERTTINADLFGFYWPVDMEHQTMMGFIIHGTNDSFDGDGVTFDVSQTLYAFSTIAFLGKQIGHGWYLRGDIGVARGKVDIDTTLVDYNKTFNGYGFLGGAGHGWKIANDTRFLIGLYFSRFNLEDDFKTSNISLSGSFLF